MQYLESDSDDEELTSINERLNGIDLNDAEQVWSSLTDSEKAEFEHLVKSGDITKIVPQYIPWWCLPYVFLNIIFRTYIYLLKSQIIIGLKKK